MKFRLLAILLLAAPAGLAFQDDVVLPWVTNNANFTGRVIINNVGDLPAEVIAIATRGNGDEEAVIRQLGPREQLVSDAGAMFPTLGEGPGYRIVVVSDSGSVTAGFLINSQSGASGNSPAQADAAGLDGGTELVFNYLPVVADGASAPVVVNMGQTTANVTFQAYQGGSLAATTGPFELESGRPFAQTTSQLFPELAGDTYVLAHSDQPLVGMAFIFNEFGEPSMANALPLLP